jgi:hypothetical protein
VTVPKPAAGQCLPPAGFLLGGADETSKEAGDHIAAPRHKSPLEEAWVKFLSPYPWQWFGTFTFREAIHPEAADKKFRYWVRLLDERNVGPRWRLPSNVKKTARWVRGLEWQKRNVLHYHALIGNLPPFGGRDERREWEACWNGLRNGGFARVDQVGIIGGVVGYVSKYVAKGGQIDLSATLPRFMPELVDAAI